MKTYNPNIHQRKSIRLKGYDYTQAGLYFITICTKNRACLFGNIAQGKMILNDAGKNANECWLEIPNHFSNTQLHQHIIMPNHIHGIIEIVGANQHSPNNANQHSPKTANHHSPKTANHHSPKTANHHSPNTGNQFPLKNNDGTENIVLNDIWAKNISPLRSPSQTIGSVVRGFKIGVTKWFRENMGGKFPIGEPVWQRNYYDHIIRDQKSYQNISEYIMNNPVKWHNDKFYKS